LYEIHSYTATSVLITGDLPPERAMADAPEHAPANLRLPAFWCDSPRSWFTMAEAQFRLRNITGDNDKYLCLIAALPRDAFRMVAHIVEQEDQADQADDAYEQLKASLVSSHTMSDYQRIELLSKVEPLGGRKPSDLLATMLELCPRGHESSPFFCYLFLQRLPREIRVLLAEEDAANKRAIAEKADRYMAIHAPQAHDSVVAAATASRSKQKQKKPVKKPSRRRSISPSTKRPALCFYHFRFGEKARHCEEPCSWSGNE
jgi:hypothetical protein